MNFIFAGSNISCDSINLFFKNNLKNIDVIVIDYSLFLKELIRLELVSVYSNDLFDIFKEEDKSLSSPEIINEVINFLYTEDEESFLYKSFFYSIPIFISNGEALLRMSNYILYDKDIDLSFLRKINEEGKLNKILLSEKNNELTLFEILSSMGALNSGGYRSLYCDEYLEDTDGSGYLYEEIMDYDR